jgi:hypothetical protein
MKNPVYVKPECKTFALAKELLFSTSGEEPITPGIDNVEDNNDDNNANFFPTRDINRDE